MHSVDSSNSEKREQDFVRHHHYIACKDYDRTIMKKVRSIMNLDYLNQAYQQDQKEGEEKILKMMKIVISKTKQKKLWLLMMKQTY